MAVDSDAGLDNMCWWLNNQFALVQMTVFRYGNIGVWWKQQIKEVYLLHSWYYILMFVVLKLRIQKYWTANLLFRDFNDFDTFTFYVNNNDFNKNCR